MIGNGRTVGRTGNVATMEGYVMTLEQEIAELKAKHAEKEAQLVREHGILKHFAEFEEYGRPMIHFYKLYGRLGSVHFNWQRYESIAKGKNPDAELLRRLLEKFPGEPKVMCRDSCVGFRDEGNALAAKVKAEEKGLKAEMTELEPVTVKIDPAQLFACDCAENLRDTLSKDDLTDFDAYLLTIRRYAFGMATDEELEQARAWAWAWDGAWARAWAKAWARAWDGATKEQREWETVRLLQYINGDVDLDKVKKRVTP